MTGIYLKCDHCGATLGGEQVNAGVRGLTWSQGRQLRDASRDLGWTGDELRDADVCPACSLSASDALPIAGMP